MISETLARDEVIRTLRQLKPEFERRYGVSRIGVFGSVARNQARGDSDVDVVVELVDPDLFHLVHIKDSLEEHLGRPVDIVQFREKMNEYLKKHIQSEAIYA